MASPEHAAVVELLWAAGPPAEAAQRPLEQRRAEMDAATSALPVPESVSITDVEAAGVPGERHVPPGWSDGGPELLYLHGGAYTSGSVASHRSLGARLALAAGARVLVLGYRLAPEHPHPAAIEDAVAAYRWLLDGGADPARTAIAGDSAGGGLALATVLALRHAGDPLPAAAVCVSPWTDLSLTGESVDAKSDVDPICHRDTLVVGAKHYLAGGDPTIPSASPLFADLAGLPPLLVLVGTEEVLLDDSTRLAERATAAGVDVTLDIGEGLIHVYPILAGVPEAEAAVTRVGAWLTDRWT